MKRIGLQVQCEERPELGDLARGDRHRVHTGEEWQRQQFIHARRQIAEFEIPEGVACGGERMTCDAE
jgi:hypothetical protein